MPSSSNPLSFNQNPWVYLFLFLFSNTLISYSPLPLDAKLIMGLVGIVLPLYVALRTLAFSRNENLAIWPIFDCLRPRGFGPLLYWLWPFFVFTRLRLFRFGLTWMRVGLEPWPLSYPNTGP